MMQNKMGCNHIGNQVLNLIYSVLKSMGFQTGDLSWLILGEALLLCCFGLVLLGIFLAPIMSIPPQKLLGDLMNFFPVFKVSWTNIGICALLAVGIMNCHT